MLHDGNNLLLLAPRRVGKTSLMTHMADEARQRGFIPAFLSVAEVASEIAFVERLCSILQRTPEGSAINRVLAKGSVARYLKRIRKIGIATGAFELSDGAEDHWAEIGDALSLALSKSNARWLLFIDELPLFVHALIQQDASSLRARRFLSWLRELRVGPMAANGVRWFIAGSIGLDTVTRRARLGDTINDLHIVTNLGAFGDLVADSFLGELSTSYNLPLTVEVRQHIKARVGWLIPYHLQVLFAELRGFCHDTGKFATVESVDRAYDVLLSPSKKNVFDFWVQRLARELGSPDDKQALALINAVAARPGGATNHTLKQVLAGFVIDLDERDRQFHFLLDVLLSDGYFILEEAHYRFRSPLLREFWVRRVIGD